MQENDLPDAAGRELPPIKNEWKAKAKAKATAKAQTKVQTKAQTKAKGPQAKPQAKAKPRPKRKRSRRFSLEKPGAKRGKVEQYLVETSEIISGQRKAFQSVLHAFDEWAACRITSNKRKKPPRVALLTGPTGIGKTWLEYRLAQHWMKEGVSCAVDVRETIALIEDDTSQKTTAREFRNVLETVSKRNAVVFMGDVFDSLVHVMRGTNIGVSFVNFCKKDKSRAFFVFTVEDHYNNKHARAVYNAFGGKATVHRLFPARENELCRIARTVFNKKLSFKDARTFAKKSHGNLHSLKQMCDIGPVASGFVRRPNIFAFAQAIVETPHESLEAREVRMRASLDAKPSEPRDVETLRKSVMCMSSQNTGSFPITQQLDEIASVADAFSNMDLWRGAGGGVGTAMCLGTIASARTTACHPSVETLDFSSTAKAPLAPLSVSERSLLVRYMQDNPMQVDESWFHGVLFTLPVHELQIKTLSRNPMNTLLEHRFQQGDVRANLKSFRAHLNKLLRTHMCAEDIANVRAILTRLSSSK